MVGFCYASLFPDNLFAPKTSTKSFISQVWYFMHIYIIIIQCSCVQCLITNAFTCTDISQPTELDPILTNIVLPIGGGLFAILIVCITVIVGLCVCCCRRPGLKCCYRINSKGTQAAFVDDRLPGGLDKLKNKLTPVPDGAAGGSPYPFTEPVQTDSNEPTKSWVSFFKYFLPIETTWEVEARKSYQAVKDLLREMENETESITTSVVEETDGGSAKDQKVTTPVKGTKCYSETSV